MNWEALAAIADTIGSAVVVISLIYLSIQIHRQTVETKLATGNELANQLNYVYANLSDNADLAELFYQGVNDFHSLSPGRAAYLSIYISSQEKPGSYWEN